MSSQPMLCRLGAHQWFRDSARFASADVCDRCGEPRDAEQYAELVRERDLWATSARRGMSQGRAYDYVFKSFFHMG